MPSFRVYRARAQLNAELKLLLERESNVRPLAPRNLSESHGSRLRP